MLRRSREGETEGEEKPVDERSGKREGRESLTRKKKCEPGRRRRRGEFAGHKGKRSGIVREKKQKYGKKLITL